MGSISQSGFQNDFLRGSLIGKLDDILTKHYHKVGSSEMNAWRNSLSYMDRVIGLASIPRDTGVAIEYVIPIIRENQRKISTVTKN